MKRLSLKYLAPMGLLLGTSLLTLACGGSHASSTASTTTTTDAEDQALAFDATAYTTINITVDGADMAVRKYGPIQYVANPVEMQLSQTSMGQTSDMSSVYAMQQLYVYVPESSASNQTTAVWMMVNNAGWFLSPVKDLVTDGTDYLTTSGNDNAAVAEALQAGYVIVSAGTRGRGAVAADGSYQGKAPACIVDAKAAIRYLRLNDGAMPGSAERLVINGTSGGGGLVTTVAASGNNADYYPYLAEIGAAGITGSGSSAKSTLKDSVFAVTAYCPINNLAHADEGYEWQYNAIRSDSNTGALNSIAYSAGEQPAASAAIASAFPTYISGLGLKLEDGNTALTTDRMPDFIKAQLTAEVNRQIAAGVSVPDMGGSFSVTVRGTTSTYTNDWLTLTGSGTSAKVANIDYSKFLNFVATATPLKTVVAFDATGVTGNPSVSGESTLYGASDSIYSNFTEWSWNNNDIADDGIGLYDTGLTWTQFLATTSGGTVAEQLKMSSPIPYLGSSSSEAAPYWYVRHGMIDRDTSFAIQTLLYYAILNNSNVKDLNFKFPYLTPHSGNYDAPEAFTWIAEKLAANPM
nr:subtype B tannase [uncultured Holophaga sp.]